MPSTSRTPSHSRRGKNKILGFGICGPERGTGLPYAGEIYTLYVGADRRNAGVGRSPLVVLFHALLLEGSQ